MTSCDHDWPRVAEQLFYCFFTIAFGQFSKSASIAHITDVMQTVSTLTVKPFCTGQQLQQQKRQCRYR